jgi:hypothetical protein
MTRLNSRRLARAPRPLVLELLEDRLAPAVTISVDASANPHPINPNVYGVAFADKTALADLNVPINRDGGNASDTYNYQQDASNHGSDWYFESISSAGSGGQNSLDQLVTDTQSSGAQPDLTVPILPYVAKLGSGSSILGSFPTSVYGPQQYTDPYNSAWGNGVTTSGQNITDTNPLYNYIANTASFEQGWVQHLISTFGTPGNGGVPYFTLGNEPALWNSTHRDIHPAGETNTELLSDIESYAGMIKSVDPGAQVLGPEEWGWTGYFIDGADAAAQNWGATYNGLNVSQWLLQQLAAYQAANGTRLLDDFTLHYYPQGKVNTSLNEFSDDVSTAAQVLRNQSTRSLWDPSYVDQSWIGTTGVNNGIVDLIPTMRNWVNTYYPGTKIGITEYNWGAEGHMNGATAQADILGIFGREGLDLGERWTTPSAGTPVYNAIKMYRNYDGHDSSFGDTSVGATVPNADQVSAFAALRSSDGALTIMVDNKNLYDPTHPTATTTITLNVANFAGNGVAQEWQLVASDPGDATQTTAITRPSDISYSGGTITVTVPMQSVELFVLEPATQQAAPPAPTGLTAAPSNGQVTLSWTGSTGASSYNVYRSLTPGGEGATPYSAGVTTTTFTDTGLTNGTAYYYQVSAVGSGGESARTSELAAHAGLSYLAIDAGGAAAGSYLADANFSGGSSNSTTHSIDTSHVSSPAPQSVYQTWRSGNFTYTVTGLTPGLSYTLRLHFAENLATASGQRVFNVWVNGVRVLYHLDVYASAAGRYKAIVRQFTVAADATGQLAVQFVTFRGAAEVAGLEVAPRNAVSLNAGGGAAGAFISDGYFSGGNTGSTTSTITTTGVTNPAPQAVYQSERYGDFSYTMTDLMPGATYTVRLHFAEIYWTASGKRLFNVQINGAQVLTNFDVYARAGGKNKAVVRQFTPTADSSGQITIRFISVVNFAKVSGIELI